MTTLYDAVAPTWLQILGAMEGIVNKAEQWCGDRNEPAESVLGARLADDMLPFAYQIKSCWTHSALALETVLTGHFSPEMSPPPDSFDGLREKLHTAIAYIGAYDAAHLETIAQNPMVFTIKDKFRLDFTVQNFLLGFSAPNFHFHASTAYAILRMHGLPIGKADYLGAMPVSVNA